MNEKLPLYNRYNHSIYLEHIEGNEWSLKAYNEEFLDYTRIIYKSETSKEIIAIDPPGGPFLSVNNLIDTKKIKRIYEGESSFMLTLEEQVK